MRKGLLASVAALAAGAGVASGQGWPGAPAAGSPAYPGYGQATAAAPPPAPVVPPAGPPTPIPPATAAEMPHSGPVSQPGVYDPWAHGPSYDPAPMTGPNGSGQVHKAAGGPDRSYLDVEWLLWGVKNGKVNFPLVTASPVGTSGLVGQPGTVVLFGSDDIDYG